MSEWGPFEILLVIVLALGLISATGNKNSPSTSVETVNPKNQQRIEAPSEAETSMCGLTLISPVRSEKVSSSVRVRGSVEGCNWTPDGSTALYAQVINAKGVPISDFVKVPSFSVDTITTLYTEFDAVIAFTVPTATATGHLILIPAVTTNNSATVRIPLTFVRN